MIKDDMQQTFNAGVQLGISMLERKIVYASEHNKPLEIDGKVYWIESDIQHLRKIMDRSRGVRHMNVIDARDIFSKKKINQKDIEDKQSIMNIENAMLEKLRLYLHDEDFTERQIDIVVDLYKLFTMK